MIGKEKTDKMKQGANFTGMLALDNKALDDDACKILAPALAKMNGLQMLSLSYNNIGDEGCRHLAPALALAEMKGLKELRLSENNIGEEGEKVIEKAWNQAGKDIMCIYNM